jgi:uncharacterized protein YcfL
MRRLLPSLTFVLLAACGTTEDPGVVDPGSLVAEHDELAFGAVLVDGSSTARVRFQNRGRRTGA